MSYFEIGIYHGKNSHNLGTLWRSALQLGAAGIFVIGPRYKVQTSDTLKTYRHIPLRQFDDFDCFLKSRPFDCQLVCVEIGGIPLKDFKHPKRVTYLLGSEDMGLPTEVLEKAQAVISLESVNTASYNVAVAGSIIMYHRQFLVG